MDRPFVRSAMLPSASPPVTERGIFKWLRENLFSGPLNTLLTVLSTALVVWLVAIAFPWWWNGIWTASSLGECRSILAAEGADSGACWAVIKARWHQYIFGFFPVDMYWRPVLAFGLMFVALAPVLYWNDRKGAVLTGAAGVLTVAAMVGLSSPASIDLFAGILMLALFALAWIAPRQLIWVTLLFPFLVVWLLWGGSVWAPVSAVFAVALGVVAGLLYGRSRMPALNLVYALAVALGAALVASTVIGYLDSVTADFLGKMAAADFYPGFFADSGPLAKAFGMLLSALVWAVSMAVWALVAGLRWVSYALNLNASQLVDFGFAPFIGIGAVLAAVGVFIAARNRAAGLGVFGGLLALGAYWMFAHDAVVAQLAAWMPFGLVPVRSDDFGGFLLAIVIGVTAISCSLPLGILLALGRRSDMLLVKVLSVGFIEFIRGVPLITLLFTASLLLAYFLPPGTNFDLILRVIILASLFSAAYLAEVVRGGLAALPRGQYEAADALGLDYWQAQRLIIMPQALKISIPGIVSTFIGLFKDTTLVSFVGLLDPLRGVTQIVRADINWKGIYWEPYIFVGVIFFLICFGMSRYSMYLERKLKTDHR
ncbi:amino acid ABC transporter permease [Rhodobacter sp. Har01]|uniref:amino acid ABC transporter permease n=1 Tax=Rhodobacter sp. Har01 TaxID=2883999 RepID=UPI001D07D329|nr:amino acid ABC transporter permease [Rhodobacter sp. Har01]MCB6180032.1 amino acid ABC transporter permease [Rhodobacter sp. Har01]